MSEGRKRFWTTVAAAVALVVALAAGPVLADDGAATGIRVADAHGGIVCAIDGAVA